MGNLLQRLRRWRPGRQPLGPRAERAAARHLKRTGYRILARNLTGRLGEIDLVAEHRRHKTLVIVEVKAGTREDPPPEVHVNRRKQRKLTHVAADLVRRRRLEDRPVRFDVVAVVWPEDARRPTRLTHYDAAFQSSR